MRLFSTHAFSHHSNTRVRKKNPHYIEFPSAAEQDEASSSVPQDEENGSITESTPFFLSRATGQTKAEVTRRAHVIKSVLYGFQNFYAFMIM